MILKIDTTNKTSLQSSSSNNDNDSNEIFADKDVIKKANELGALLKKTNI